MHRSGEKGVALVFTLFLMAALSAMAVSMMFLAQTETSASRNYRTMSQARYAGEAGVHKAINYLIYSYANLNLEPATPFAGFTTTTAPVTYGGNPVVLSYDTTLSNYPDAAVKTAFAAAAQGSLAVGTGTVTYQATAKLLSMQNVRIYGGGDKTIQTWEITSVGTVPGPLPATVEVSAVVERDIVPAQTYAIFATGDTCGSIDLGGTSRTNSYNSTTMTTTPPATVDSGAGVGTNGNLHISGNVTVNGNLDTPRTGVGSCSAGTPTALTGGGSATVTGSIVPLPQAKVYPTPDPPQAPYLPANSSQSIPSGAAGCTSLLTGNTGALCSYDSSSKTFTVTSFGTTPLVFNNLSLGSQLKITVNYGGVLPIGSTVGTVYVNVNSLSLTGNAQFNIGTNAAVVMNVQGTGVTTPVDFSGGSFGNMSYDPSRFQMLYGGTGQIELIGGNGAAMSLYAPNARVRLNGNADIFGSVLSKTYDNQGNGSVHYDAALSSKFFTLGNRVISTFSWKKY
jgi:Tfp pilus assembly protein PilX